MKTNSLIILLLSAFIYSKSQSKKSSNLPVDSIINRHLRAIGGENVIRKIKTLSFRAVIVDETDTISAIAFLELGKKTRVQVVGKKTTQNFFVSNFCEHCAFVYRGGDKAGILLPIKQQVISSGGALYGETYYTRPALLVDYKKNDIQVDRLDREQDPYYILEVNLPERNQYRLIIDPASYLVIQSYRKDPLGDLSSEHVYTYKDFIRNSEGFYYPQRTLAEKGAQVKDRNLAIRHKQIIYDVAYNPEFPENIFSIPAEVKKIMTAKGAPESFFLKYEQ